MKCEHASELISLSCEQKLKLKDSVRLQLHLWYCPKCRGFKRNNEKLRQMLKCYCEQDKNDLK